MYQQFGHTLSRLLVLILLLTSMQGVLALPMGIVQWADGVRGEVDKVPQDMSVVVPAHHTVDGMVATDSDSIPCDHCVENACCDTGGCQLTDHSCNQQCHISHLLVLSELASLKAAIPSSIQNTQVIASHPVKRISSLYRPPIS